MVTFLICVSVLLLSYFTYGRFLERKLDINFSARVPSDKCYDGVDYIPLSLGRTFLIQLLNITGLSPIFGALLGAAFGPVALLWITFGGIFMGALQDFAVGAISMHNGGRGFPELVGKYLGPRARIFTGVMTMLLLLIVSAVFTDSPAVMLSNWTIVDKSYWVAIIVLYYILATILPIDKIIGRLYPFFGILLIAMTLVLVVTMFAGDYHMVEITGFSSLGNMHYLKDKMPLLPMLFVTITCGVVSGFHATQSPIMARCIRSEREARPVYFGAMIAESIVTLVWTSVGMCFFGGVEQLGVVLSECNGSAPDVVGTICTEGLGSVAGMVVLVGIIAATITSGDTAFRMTRLTVADFFKIEQRSVLKRVSISVPLFMIAFIMTSIDFDVLWRYMAWVNLILAAMALWMVCGYMRYHKRGYIYALIPALFMTFIIFSYISGAGGMRFEYEQSLIFSAIATCSIAILFFFRVKNPLDMSGR
ncbi:MAG: carbon starvation protein A [Rikenellaceae bacterium]|nr:carbon starvation protein A [Rikenellaceae bacterium]